MSERYDAVVVGSGPNGLAAAIELVRRGLHVHLIEGHDVIGGGLRTAELTLPGYRHDVCSTAHPFVEMSPFFSALPLTEFGLQMVTSPAAVAHPFDDEPPAILERSVEQTATSLGPDAEAYRRLMNPLVKAGAKTVPSVLGPLWRVPRHPLSVARFGATAIRSGKALANRFRTERAKGLFAGLAAHSAMPLNRAFVGGVAATLGIAGHTVGWPIVAGGSASLAQALSAYFVSLGGSVETGRWVNSLSDIPRTDAVLLDVTPRQFASLAKEQLSESTTQRYLQWVYGPASFKLDLAVSEPIPWRNRELQRTATVHLGGSYRDIAKAEWEVWHGRMVDGPFVLLNQATLFDPSRAPQDGHTVWAYCHVPARWDGDATEAIVSQIDRFAPGFRDTILASHVMTPLDYERYNPNNVGGAIGGGAMTVGQMFRRPTAGPQPYATEIPHVYLCSASTPPGAGTHGMCGYHAARTALRKTFGKG